MNDQSPKIFPRNLTARAAQAVRGNPVNSRPESAVDNCYPGLEFDQRNLDRRFFPGLRVEFHRGDGAVVAGFADEHPITALSLTDTDSPPDRRLYIWYLQGRRRIEIAEPEFFGFQDQRGIEVWSIVHDLLPGLVGLIIGAGGGRAIGLSPDEARDLLKTPESRVVRDPTTNLIHYAVLVADRCPYLDEAQVIDPERYQPGTLTQSMCAPWIYDFRDCYCYYWASNRPDLVTAPGPEGDDRLADFMRQHPRLPAEPDVPSWLDRGNGQLAAVDLMRGDWNRLPVVLDDRESASAIAGMPAHKTTEHLTRAEVVAELRYLATVEHALMVEYLFAMYSLKTTRTPPAPDATPEDLRIFDAGRQLLDIAVDEMRHFLWVNRLLRMLGERPSTGRAKILGQAPTRASGRRRYGPERGYLGHVFTLAPLDPPTLQWFIDVEAPSQVIDHGLDGMYVELLRSVQDQPGLFPGADRMVPVLKLIVDEGGGHYRRFMRIRDALKGLRPERYLRPLNGTPTPLQRTYLKLADGYYQAVLDVIDVTFELSDRAGGVLVRDAIRSMENLDDVARTLAVGGVGLRFALRSSPRTQPADTSPQAIVGRREAQMERQARRIAKLEPGSGSATRQPQQVAELFGRFRETIEKERNER